MTFPSRKDLKRSYEGVANILKDPSILRCIVIIKTAKWMSHYFWSLKSNCWQDECVSVPNIRCLIDKIST